MLKNINNMKKKDKSKETNLIPGEKVKIQRTEEEKISSE